MTPQAWRLLRDTSRSFFLSLRALPRRVRHSIALAYLLARSTDTVADVTALPVEERLEALDRMRAQIRDPDRPPTPILESWLAGQPRSPEGDLLRHWPRTVALLATLPPEDRADVRNVLDWIVEGQRSDLMRFGHAPARQTVAALGTAAELEHYTFCVAGCVGEFWTRVCRRHLFPQRSWDESAVLLQAVEFGKGLQLVNILRDLAADLRQGRCYLPREELDRLGLQPIELRQPAVWPRLQPCYEQWRRRALHGLARGWDYTLNLPRRQVRLRLACAWPLLIGARTLAGLQEVNPLDPAQRVKVPRSELRAWIARTLLLYPWPDAWARLFARACR